MTALPWFKCYPTDFREGMVGLTCEERGAYITVLLLIYERGGSIPDDDAWLAANLWCSLRAWKKIRASLIVKGKLFALNVNGVDSLMNRRAADEIARTVGICEARKTAGKEGGKRSAAKRIHVSNENSDLDQANASELVNQTPSKIQPDIQTIRKSSVASPDGEPTGADTTPNGRAWNWATSVLVAQGGITIPSAKAFFGKLLSQHGLEASELLGAIGEAEHLRTADPQGFLTRAAQSRNRKRQTGPPKRVDWV